MQSILSKIIIVLILLVAVGGAAGWYLLQPHSSPQSGIQTSYNGGSNTTETNVTTSSSQSQTQTQALPDVEQAYQNIFKQLSATEIVFTTVDASTTGPAANIYALYAGDIAQSKKLYPATADFSIQVAAVDLNQDGTAEALVYENLPGFCGAGGCELDIYQDEAGKWTKISSMLADGDIGLSNTASNGYLDLFLSVPGEVGSQENIVRYTWDGTEYRASAPVATWDGSAFQAVQ